MFNIFKKKKVVEEQPKPKVGSYRIVSKLNEHFVERYCLIGADFTFGPRFGWKLIHYKSFDTIETAKQWIKQREERISSPVTYTEVNIDEL